MKSVLYSGVEMPILGFGVYQISDAESVNGASKAYARATGI